MCPTLQTACTFTNQSVLSQHALHRNDKLKIKLSQRLWNKFRYYHFSSGELTYFLFVWLAKCLDVASHYTH